MYWYWNMSGWIWSVPYTQASLQSDGWCLYKHKSLYKVWVLQEETKKREFRKSLDQHNSSKTRKAVFKQPGQLN